jgi:uroporphyrinogen decarboxylase
MYGHVASRLKRAERLTRRRGWNGNKGVMNKVERVEAVLDGRRSDRPPVSFWHHFHASQVAGAAAVEAHARFVETYDLDFLKIMDDNRYPRSATPTGVIGSVEDLDRLSVLGGDEDSFGRQLELIGALSRRFAGHLRMATTVFNAWSTLRNMTVPHTDSHGPPTLERSLDPRDTTMTRFFREAPGALERALEVVSESLSNFVSHCLTAGADGVFLSVRDDWVDTPENGAGMYDRFVKKRDLQILAAAARGTFNMLHVCGKALDFRRFAAYPTHVINWADRYAGPTIAEAIGSTRAAICAGCDNLGTMVSGSPADCASEVDDALRQAGALPIMIAPGCTFDPEKVSPENLRAIRHAVERFRS